MNEKICRYKLLDLLGKGAFGKVFRAIDTITKKEVAVKIIFLKGIAVGILKQNIKEIQMLSSIKSRHVLRLFDAFFEYTQNELWIILEYMDASSLSNLIDLHSKDQTFIAENTVWKYFIQLIVGLRTIHRHNIIHRDIKPGNVLLTEKENNAKISDFNLSEFLEEGVVLPVVGTPSYIAPEVWKDAQYSFGCDIFSLGCVIYELITLKTAFYKDNMNDLKDMIVSKPPIRMTQSYSSELVNLINGCMVKDPERRLTIKKIFKNPTFIFKAKELGINLEDETSANFRVNEVKLVPMKDYPNEKGSKEFKDVIINSICHFNVENLINLKKNQNLMKASNSKSSLVSFITKKSVEKKEERADKYSMPISNPKKTYFPLFKDNEIGEKNKLQKLNEQEIKNKKIMFASPKKNGDKEKLPIKSPIKLAEKEILSDQQLRFLLKMQIKIVDRQSSSNFEVVSRKTVSIAPSIIAKYRNQVMNLKNLKNKHLFLPKTNYYLGNKDERRTHPNDFKKNYDLDDLGKAIDLKKKVDSKIDLLTGVKKVASLKLEDFNSKR